MKLSELKHCVDLATERKARAYEDDPEVRIRTDNASVGGPSTVGITHASIGSDWTRNTFVLVADCGVVKYRTYSSDKSTFGTANLARQRLEELKAAYAKVGQKFIPKSREEDWIDGFMEGFKMFGLEVDK